MTAGTIDRWATGWGDRLHPVLVKEVRENLRSRWVTGAYVVLHLVFVFGFLVALTDGSPPERDADDVAEWLWSTLILVLLVLLPMVGFASGRFEFAARKIELLFLARLTPVSIVRGRWYTLLLLGGLFIAAVEPYFVLLYFLGGVDLGDEMVMLAALVLVSTGAAAVGVSLGCIPGQANLAWQVVSGGSVVATALGGALVGGCVLLAALFFGLGVWALPLGAAAAGTITVWESLRLGVLQLNLQDRGARGALELWRAGWS